MTEQDVLIKEPRQKGDKAQTIETILTSARFIAISQGAEHVTIDAVAKNAGFSKGGVLYHFPNKRLLMKALMDSYVAHLQQKLDSAIKLKAKDKRPLLSGFIHWFKKYNAGDAENKNWGAAIFAVQAFDPTLMEPLRLWYKNLFQLIRKECDTSLLVSILAIEALFLLRMYDLDFLTDKEHKQVMSFLENLSRSS